MSTPRDDVYRVAALLDAVRRVLDPLPPAGTLSGTPAPEPPPPLPPDRRRSR